MNAPIKYRLAYGSFEPVTIEPYDDTNWYISLLTLGFSTPIRIKDRCSFISLTRVTYFTLNRSEGD